MKYEEFYNNIQLNLDVLNIFNSENKYLGYPTEEAGAVWEEEGKSIYNLIRFIKPNKILEIGNFKGVSSNHILSAVERNKKGEVHLLDIIDQIDYTKIHNKNFIRIISNSLYFLQNKYDYDFFIIDGCHEYNHVKKELNLILQNNIKRPFYIWAHDYFAEQSDTVNVKKAWDEIDANKFEFIYKICSERSNCGFVFAKAK